nr:gluconokinase [uncultured Nocardioides sp.]
MHIVVMGVTGTGKTSVGRSVAEAMECEYGEGDDFHPPANVEKMRSGTPLSDEDRQPWLESLAAWTRARHDRGESAVLACSALRRVYRDVLRTGAEDTVFAHLVGDPTTIRQRMEGRRHFMPSSLLQSQLDTLEPLEPDERGFEVDVGRPLADVVEDVLQRLGQLTT